MAYGVDTKQLLRKLRACESSLSISGLRIDSLPPLHRNLKYINCSGTQISALPELPANLQILDIENTQITVLPRLPRTLKSLRCENTMLLLQREEDESIDSYRLRWEAWWMKEERRIEEVNSKNRIQDRCRELKEDLMIEVWHPRRIEKWLKDGGFELLDSF